MEHSQFLQAVKDKDLVKAEDLLLNHIQDKITAKIMDKKVEIKNTLFNTPKKEGDN